MESSEQGGAGGSERRGAVAVLMLSGLWVLTALEALGMGAAGAAKFVGGAWPGMFEGWGYPAGFAYVVGIVEVGGALLLLFPRFASYAAGLLIVVMLGALLTLATTSFQTQLGLGLPAVHVVVLVVLLWARWPRRWRAG